MGREWIKLHVDKWLDGSTRNELSPAERAIWIDFLALAGRYQKDGKRDGVIIAARDSLSRMLSVDRRLLDRAVDKFLKTGKITIDEEGIIHIVNWDRYNPSRWDLWAAEHPDEASKDRHKQSQTDANITQCSQALERSLSPSLSKSKSKEEDGVVKGKGEKAQTFEQYVDSLRSKFPNLDIDGELEKFRLWWSEGNRTLKKPKLAALNWMKKAEEIRLEKASARGTGGGRGVPKTYTPAPGEEE